MSTVSNYIVTRSGGKFFFNNPYESQYTIGDIAHALSKLCRFVGHSSVLYSVATHSILVSRLVPREFALTGLLHDAAEAFCGDIASPLKAMLPNYRELEHDIQYSIFARFNAPWSWPIEQEVKKADLMALAMEKRDLLPLCEDWEILKGIEPLPIRTDIEINPRLAELEFLELFQQYGGKA